MYANIVFLSQIFKLKHNYCYYNQGVALHRATFYNLAATFHYIIDVSNQSSNVNSA